MAIFTAAALAIMVFGWQVAAIARSAAGWGPGADSGAGAPVLTLSAVHAQRLVRGGKLAIRVEGRITNRSPSRQPLSAVDIIVAQGHGKPAQRWAHVPTLAYLEPGQTIRFATAKGDIGRPAEAVEVRFAGLSEKAEF